MIKKAYKFRLYPTDGQCKKLAMAFGCARFVWNNAVAGFNEKAEMPSIPALKVLHPFLADVSCSILQQKQRDFLEFKTQFFSKTRKAKIARPRFKKRGVNDSFRLPNQKFKVLESKIQIEKIGKIAFVKDRELPESARTLSVTVSKNPSGQYFASVLVEQEIAPFPKTGKSVGVDLGLKTFAVTSDGKEYAASKFFRESQSRLRTAQKHLSRKKKGSIRFKRCKLKVAKIHRKTANRRSHFIHSVTNDLVVNYDTIVIEDLNVAGMVKNRKLSKSIYDAAFSETRRQITYKCAWYGKALIVADRWFASSKTCSGCGEVKKILKLSERTFVCECCGLTIDRDENAAINLKNKSVRVLAA